MAEFKNINSFDLVTPNATTSKSMYLQVNDTQRVSVEGIARLAQELTLDKWFSTPTYSFPISKTDSVIGALKKLAGLSSNSPARLVTDKSRAGFAVCVAGLGLYIFKYNNPNNINNVWVKIKPFPDNNWQTDTDDAIITYLNNTGTGGDQQYYLPQHRFIAMSNTSVSSLQSGQVIYCSIASGMQNITIDSTNWASNLNSAMVFAPHCKCPKSNIKLLNGTQTGLHFMKGFDEIAANGTNVCIVVQYLGTNDNSTHHFLINACSYDNQ